MSDETIWVDGPNGKIPYNIQTQAGREIWTEINLKGGSIYWGPLGRALPEVEAEAMRMAEERIIALLETEIDEKDKKRVSGGLDFDTRLELSQDIVLLRRVSGLIKGENE